MVLWFVGVLLLAMGAPPIARFLGGIFILLLLLLTACTADGPVGSRSVTCLDRPTDAPVASRCE
jgi:hypothetical protein